MATGATVLPKTVAGSWKFKRHGHFSIDVAVLTVTAQELVNLNPGGGIYRKVYIRSTAKKELGICFIYEPSDAEWYYSELPPEWKLDPYKDFFQRRHGMAFAGYSIGHSVTEIVLAER